MTAILVIFLAIPCISAENITIDNTTSIQDSINDANVDDTIYLNQGIYKQSNITIEKDLTIEGKESPEKVIIDGESKNGIIKSHSPIKLTVRNITFINGFNIGNGGAIYFNGVGQLTIENCNFINNKITDKDGEGQGGAVFTTGDAKSHMQLTIKKL